MINHEERVCVSVKIGKPRSGVFVDHTFQLSYIVAKALLSGNRVVIEIDGYNGEYIPQFKAEGSIKNETL